MTKINILPQLLRNKIAAGEVIERPAAVVKELIENSLDANSTEIEITVENGGKKLIRIIDNGGGIPQSELGLAWLSYTTSKINQEKDLYAICSLGFRGEALASIAAVAQVKMISKPSHQDCACVVEVPNGKPTQPQPAAGSNGTCIEVRNIFFNTPARRNFLKSTSVELSHITNVVRRFALAYPKVRFSLLHHKQTIFNLLPVDDLKQRIEFFFGDELVKNLVFAQYEVNDQKLSAYFSLPNYTRPNAQNLFYYLNQRHIRDRFITHAIMQAYSELIPAGRYPAVFLFMQMPAESVDINVHPTKTEVRFRQAWQVHDNILALIKDKLFSQDLNLSPSLQTSTHHQTETTVPGEINQNDRTMKALVDFFATNPSTQQTQSIPYPNTEKTFSPRSADQTSTIQQETHTGIYPQQPGRHFQIHNAYIIEEIVDGFLVIDQHALHERILYDRFTQQVNSSSIYKQRLLIPVIIELAPQENILINEALPYLQRLGMETEVFGRNTIRVLAAPMILNNVNLSELIHQFLEEFPGGSSNSSLSKTELTQHPLTQKLTKMFACKAAVKAGNTLNDQEIKSLLEQRNASDFTLTCPHGRPAVRKISLDELAKYFARK
ncbi:DNA mismatch repair endonuclease MutL [Planctomycetota bacterium]